MPAAGGGPGSTRIDYRTLFGPEMAARYGFHDPVSGAPLDLCALFERGLVHEVWVNSLVEIQDGTRVDVVPEEFDNRQKYDPRSVKIAGAFDRCAGNGCFQLDEVPHCAVTVKISGLNPRRGVGCKLHATGHAIEGIAGGSVPYFAENFAHFANRDFETRLGAPFKGWFGICGNAGGGDGGQDGGRCSIEYGADHDSVFWSGPGQSGVFQPFHQGCGNVHFPPNAHANYDYESSAPVLSTCEHYGMKDGPDGNDLATLYTNASAARYASIAPDCGGAWNVYWRQSIPGLHNQASAVDGQPMKNLWPFLFY